MEEEKEEKVQRQLKENQKGAEENSLTQICSFIVVVVMIIIIIIIIIINIIFITTIISILHLFRRAPDPAPVVSMHCSITEPLSA